MPFYRKRLSYDEVAPAIQKFRDYLRLHAPVARELSDHDTEAFLISQNLFNSILKDPQTTNIYGFMLTAKYLTLTPFDNKLGYLLTINQNAEGTQPTVAPDYLRLPKLSHLITLTPDDFFLFMRLISTSKKTSAGDSMSLNPAAAGCRDIHTTALNMFFTKLRTNYRLNPDYADRKWTARDDVIFISNLEPNRENQLMAMQYLTATQNIDLMYFPMETSLDLELDWEQLNNDYCVPPSFAGTDSLISAKYK